MKKIYTHFSEIERSQIYALNKQGVTQKKIAEELKKDQSSISRELKRNKGKRGYRFQQAQKMSEERRSSASTTSCIKISASVITMIEEFLVTQQWSPVQISGHLKKEHGIQVSHETIYKHIWDNKKQGGSLYKHLRHAGKKYNKRSGKNAGRGCIPNRIGIEERPSIVEEKSRIGDFEIDTIIGKNHKMAIVSVVDRKSKYTKLIKVEAKTSSNVSKAIIDALMPYKEHVLTLTADNGKEFAGHQSINNALDATVYFANPYHSWERGLNEHTNGLVRQYFPKKHCFVSITDDDVARVELLLNTRPRAALNFKTPRDVFFESLTELQKIALHG